MYKILLFLFILCVVLYTMSGNENMTISTSEPVKTNVVRFANNSNFRVIDKSGPRDIIVQTKS